MLSGNTIAKKIQISFKTTFSVENLKLIKKYKAIYVMMLPVLLYFIVFSYYPLILGLIQSFQKSQLIGNPTFNGIQNYVDLFNDYQFRQAFVNSFTIGAGTQIMVFVFALILALGINEVRFKFVKTSIQTVSYLPNLFSWTVVGGMWVTILSSNGMLNGFLNLLGQPSVQFMADRNCAKLIMILTGAWKDMGYYALLFLASLVSIDGSIYEAAQIDGATRIRQITNITVPELIPTMKIIIILATMGFLRNFDQVFVMENSMILDKIRTLLLYIYTEGILQFKVGVATSAATVVLVTTIVITSIVRKLIRYDENY